MLYKLIKVDCFDATQPSRLMQFVVLWLSLDVSSM